MKFVSPSILLLLIVFSVTGCWTGGYRTQAERDEEKRRYQQAQDEQARKEQIANAPLIEACKKRLDESIHAEELFRTVFWESVVKAAKEYSVTNESPENIANASITKCADILEDLKRSRKFLLDDIGTARKLKITIPPCSELSNLSMHSVVEVARNAAIKTVLDMRLKQVTGNAASAIPDNNPIIPAAATATDENIPSGPRIPAATATNPDIH